MQMLNQILINGITGPALIRECLHLELLHSYSHLSVAIVLRSLWTKLESVSKNIVFQCRPLSLTVTQEPIATEVQLSEELLLGKQDMLVLKYPSGLCCDSCVGIFTEFRVHADRRQKCWILLPTK